MCAHCHTCTASCPDCFGGKKLVNNRKDREAPQDSRKGGWICSINGWLKHPLACSTSNFSKWDDDPTTFWTMGLMTVVLLVTNNASLNLSIYIGTIGDITRACVLRRVDVISMALFRNGRNHASTQNWRHQNFTAFKSLWGRFGSSKLCGWAPFGWPAETENLSLWKLERGPVDGWEKKLENDGGVMDEAHEMNSLFAFSFRIESC